MKKKPALRLEKSEDIIDICLDPVFKAVFTKDTPDSRGALSALISAIINKKVSVIKIVANEPPVDNKNDRQIRYDIQCKINGGELVNIEMTIYPETFEPARLEFHVTKLLHSFEYYDKENDMSLGGMSRIFTIELKKLDKIAQKPAAEMSSVERWAIFFRYLTNKEKRETINEILEAERGIEMAGRALLTVSRDERERARLMSEYKYITDTQSKVVYAEQRGEKRGEKRGRKEIINLLKSGKSVEDVIKMYS